MSISLSKNQTISLAKSGSGLRKVFMGLGWDPVKSGGLFGFLGGGSESIDLDASVLVYDANKRLLTTVYFRELSAYNSAIEHGGDNLTGDGDGDDREDSVQREDGKDDVVECALSGGDLHRFSSPMRETTTVKSRGRISPTSGWLRAQSAA